MMGEFRDQWDRRMIGVGLLFVLAVVGEARAQSLSPGPLSQVHAALDDAARCGMCHETGREVSAARCGECHPTAVSGRGLHADLVRSTGGGCGGCHEEHHGRSFRLVHLDAQVPGFRHDQTGFPLTGRHASVDCGRCHKGKLKFQGLSQRCASCHEDRHGGQFAGDCATCHTTQTFAGATGFRHDRSWPLAGRHAALACSRCHPERGGRGDRQWKGLPHAACSDCHKDPHAGQMRRPCAECHVPDGWRVVRAGTARDHAPGRFPLEGRHATTPCGKCHGRAMERKVEPRCASCHQEPHEGRLGPRCEACHDAQGWHARSAAAFDHSRTRYPLEGRHRSVACTACHRPGPSYAKRFRDLRYETCRACHEDRHQTTFTSVEAGDRCETCHTVSGFEPSMYDVRRHDRAVFPLTGAHRAVPCARCHRPAGSDRARLRIPERECANCHPDPHQGAFDKRMAGKGCAACHSVASWRVADFDHASTRFPLTGRHQGVACRACHGTDLGGTSPSFTGLSMACASCHVDRHEGQFDAPRAAGTFAPAPRECGECHGTETFKVPEFDHAAKTGWALEGRHALTACANCHPRVSLPGGGETTLWRPTDPRCDSCHQDPHALKMSQACSDCHRSAASWWRVASGVAFDHSSTGFPLAGRHAGLACGRCHDGALRLAGGGGLTCSSCHRDDPHRGREGPECEECHTPRGWAVGGEVRSHERTRFPLTGAHRVADCIACHASVEPPVWAGIPRECAACHADDYARPGNHPDHVTAGFSMRCDECHGTYDWRQARVRHSFWPLRGAHAAAQCFQCHEGNRYAGTPRECEACHEDDYVRAGHPAQGYPTTCAECHSEGSWNTLRSGWHDGYFPLREGHGRLLCADCHPARPPAFTCTGCHEHSRDRMDAKHRERAGYVYQDAACRSCHPRGGD